LSVDTDDDDAIKEPPSARQKPAAIKSSVAFSREVPVRQAARAG
jgi:hypothetical protein